MRRLLLLIVIAAFGAQPAQAADQRPEIRAAIEGHILPGFTRLATSADALAEAAKAQCAPASPPLRAAYQAAFDAWIEVSHLRFGPTEVDNRAFALAFWPDTRGATPKTLRRMIADEDSAVHDQATFKDVSIAARGFYGLEYLLYDQDLAGAGAPAYRCALIIASARDIAATSAAILDDWRGRYVGLMTDGVGGAASPYRTPDEAAQELFKSLMAGLEFTADARLGRPLGSFDRPRPERAEARRGGRSLRNVALSMTAMEAMATVLAADHPEVRDHVASAFEKALHLAARLDDPVFAGVNEPQGRLKVEILQQSIRAARDKVANELGPALGVAEGFNAMDGD
ncbi:MAG: imelysin family protein [Paracoccaceae bacterium]